jgi:hypothetical protein
MYNAHMDKLTPYLVALAGAIVAGTIQVKQDQLLPTVAFLLLAGLAMGAAWPNGSWRWAIILGLGIPAAYLLAPFLGIAVNEATRPNIIVSAVAILPALAGTSSGVVMRYTYKQGKP